MAMTDLAAIRAELRTLLAAATPPPWAAFIDNYGDDTWPGSMFITADPRESQAPLCDDLTQADAALIVAAVNALPALLADTPSVEPAGLRAMFADKVIEVARSLFAHYPNADSDAILEFRAALRGYDDALPTQASDSPEKTT